MLFLPFTLSFLSALCVLCGSKNSFIFSTFPFSQQRSFIPNSSLITLHSQSSVSLCAFSVHLCVIQKIPPPPETIPPTYKTLTWLLINQLRRCFTSFSRTPRYTYSPTLQAPPLFTPHSSFYIQIPHSSLIILHSNPSLFTPHSSLIILHPPLPQFLSPNNTGILLQTYRSTQPPNPYRPKPAFHTFHWPLPS
jgi:hypothetical protein